MVSPHLYKLELQCLDNCMNKDIYKKRTNKTLGDDFRSSLSKWRKTGLLSLVLPPLCLMHFPPQRKGRQEFLPSVSLSLTHTHTHTHICNLNIRDQTKMKREKKLKCVQVPKSRIAIRCSEARLFPAPAVAATRTAQPPTQRPTFVAATACALDWRTNHNR